MIVETHLLTAEQFFQSASREKRTELVRGEVVEVAPASEEHGKKGMRLVWRLAQFVEEHKLGETYLAETGFVLAHNPDTVRAPDFAFVSNERIATDKSRGVFFDGAPDLAMEVASPSESADDIQEKVIEYLIAGTRMVIYLHPRTRTITVYRSLTDIRVLLGRDTLEGGDVLPGFRVAVSEIFKQD